MSSTVNRIAAVDVVELSLYFYWGIISKPSKESGGYCWRQPGI